MFYPLRVAQLSLFSAEASRPRLTDLAGLLCGPGQVTSFGRTAARLSAVVEEAWRASALARECARHGAEAHLAANGDGLPLVRTAFRADLLPLADAWTAREAQPTGVKTLPPGLALSGAMVRVWALAGGTSTERGYLLPLDPDASGTHETLAVALRMLGVPVSTVGARAGGPALRVTGRRRLATLAELVGPPPPGAEPAWPDGTSGSRTSAARRAS